MTAGRRRELWARPQRRALLAPEVLQTSALDCGPAALGALLAGFGLARPLDELRDACRTGRDGTSIDALEAVAAEMGLAAEQVLVPPDHLPLREAACVPCILVVTRPGGAAHFVVLWRLHGRRAQLMDPAAGRRWLPLAALDREIHRHRVVAPAAAWRAWAASEEGLRSLGARLAALGVGPAERQALLRAAAAAPGWRPLGALDAAARFTRQLVAAGGVRRGRDAARMVAVLLERAGGAGAGGEAGVLPDGCWSVRAVAGTSAHGGAYGAAGDERLIVEGAVLVRVHDQPPPRRPNSRAGSAKPLADSGGPRRGSGATRATATVLPGLHGRALPRQQEDSPVPAAGGAGGAGRGRAVVVLATALGAAGHCVEAVLLVAALELLVAAPSRRLGLAVLGALVALAAALLALDAVAAGAAQELGRRRESGLRLRLAAKLPRLPDRYLRTRLLSDLAERAHLLAQLRRGPELAAAALRAGLDGVLAAGGIAWLDPALGAGAAVAALAAAGLPLLLLPRCEERSRRVRAHGAALGGLCLDLLRGLAAVRAHGAAVAMRRRHDEHLAGWVRARRAADSAGTWLLGGTQALLSCAAAGLVLADVRRHGLDPRALLVVAWTAQLAGAGQRLAVLAGRELPLARTLSRRIEELLAAGEEVEASDPPRQRPPAARLSRSGVELAFERVTVEAEGRALLRRIELAIPAGQHVAILGRSGAGKSTLLGTLLGWHRPVSGRLLVDGQPAGPGTLRELRRAIAWVAPEVALWRGSLLANLLYGGGEAGPAPGAAASDGADGTAAGGAPAPAEALRAALLLDLVPRLPEGMRTALGEAGGRLSGGEGQRLRFARAWRRRGVRLTLLDEPWRGLGADQRRQLLAAARARWRRATLLCVTHAPAEAAGFDRLLVLQEGRVVEDGSPGSLAARRGSLYRAMLEAEARAGEALRAPRWRRLVLADGRLREDAPARTVTAAATPREGPAAGVSFAARREPGEVCR
jgi:ABC-type bacteriocin/lantibiotic exporter with double-glycine peptidase domain